MSTFNPAEPDPSVIGGVPKAPYVRLPDPAAVFARRGARFAALAASGELAPYLTLLAAVSQAQAEILPALPEPPPPSAEALERARQFAMPPLDRSAPAADQAPDPVLRQTCRRLFDALDPAPKPAAAQAALNRLRAADDRSLDDMIAAALADAAPDGALAEQVFLASALQVHFARLAARLPGERLIPVSVGVCPACGARPGVSVISDRPGSEGVRYAACSLCATQWNEVRIKCLGCGSTERVGLQEIEGQGGAIKAETCDGCGGYLKVLYQEKDPALDPVADDVASLALDQLLRETIYRRIGANPFLAGY